MLSQKVLTILIFGFEEIRLMKLNRFQKLRFNLKSFSYIFKTALLAVEKSNNYS